MSVVVVIPSRGRPERALDAVHAAIDTAELPETRVVLAVDQDDPCYQDYWNLPMTAGLGGRRDGRPLTILGLFPASTGNLVKVTNHVSVEIAQKEPDSIIGNLGDDHICRTPGWDRLISEALIEPGIAYGDDLLQRERLPTAPFISASIVNALGWYMVPTLTHMYVDDAWKALGSYLGCLRYVPEVVIEHLHPGAGKAKMDAGYLRADASTAADQAEFIRWRNTSFYADVENVRMVLA